MHVERNRIFVGNLPPSVTESDIKKQFGQYGNVVSVEIKHRKENVNTNENVSSVFAFVSIETDKNQLYECFQSIANYNWNGYYVKLELAKESFLERLKREREEAQNNQSTITPVKPIITETNLTPSKLLTTSSSNKKIYVSSSSDDSSSSSSSSDEDDVKVVKIKKDKKCNSKDEVQDLIIKNNKYKQLTNGKITIEAVNSTPIHIITKKQNGLYKDGFGQKLTPADEKRLNSLYKLKESYNQQKSLVKNALSQIDTKTPNNNKIIFDDEGRQTNKRKQHFDGKNYEKTKKEKVSLFAEDEDDDDINFEIKNQFEGKKGQRLLELQSRYTNDKRFTLDSRFVDEDNDEIIISDEFEENEKYKQLEILETVIGKKINKIPEQDQNKKNTHRGMLRYDPTNVDHSKFEIKEKSVSVKESKKNQKIEENKVDEAPVEVSKETFYKVTDDLKQTFKESEGFSLLTMFGQTDNEDKKEEAKYQESTKLNRTKFNNERNPFRYDSSDSEEDEVVKVNKIDVKKIKLNFQRPISGENFFFKNEDKRLKDGLGFLIKFSGNARAENAEKFTETRRVMKQIFRSKLRNSLRNNQLFRKKIGQHKHLKIKKAMKN